MGGPLVSLWKQTLGAGADWESLSSESSFRPAAHATDQAPAQPWSPGGPDEDSFARLEVLGQGGMGTVYSARQRRLERVVAVKKLRADRRPAARAGFTAEALLCGRLEHPNIVPVYDLDADDDGEPFLAMKLVEGQSWRELLVTAPDDLPRHLDILLALCNALAFAHSRGVVHLDIKPGNVMLGPFGEVLLVDWGLAAELPGRSAPTRPTTAIRSPCGTPAYMPPELARGDGPAVGPWTDVYLLGATLYRVLCGRPPRGGALPLAIEAAGAGRYAPLPEELPEELRALCTRALAAEPEARFADVRSFGDALRAYLQHKESLAISAEARRRLQASAARDGYQRFAEALAGFHHARQLWEANPEARAGRWETHLAYADCALERGDLGLAGSQLDQLEALPGKPGPDVGARRRKLAAAHAARRRAGRRARLLRRTLVAVTLGLLVSLGAAAAIFFVKNAEITHNLAVIDEERGKAVEQARRAEARGAIARQGFDQLMVQVARTLVERAGDARSLARAEEILSTAERGLELLIDTEMGEEGLSHASALSLLTLAQVRATTEGRSANLALLERAQGRFEQIAADSARAEAHELATTCLVMRANALGRADRAAAIALLEEALPAAEARWQAQPGTFPLGRALSLLHAQLCWQLGSEGENARSTRHAEAAVAICERLLPLRPRDEALRTELGDALGHVARSHMERGETEAAYAVYRRQRAVLEELWRADRESWRAIFHLAACISQCGDAERRLGLAEAEQSYRRAVELTRQLWERAPSDHRTVSSYKAALQRLSELYRRRQELDRALPLSDEDVALQRRAVLRDPEDAEALEELAGALCLRATIQQARGSLEAAREDLLAALEAVGAAAAADSVRASARGVEASIRNELSTALVAQGDSEAALREAERARALGQALVAEHPETVRYRRSLAIAHKRAGAALERLDRAPDAEAEYRAALALCEELSAIDPADAEARRHLGVALIDIGRVRGDSGRHAAGADAFEAAVALLVPLADAAPDRRRPTADAVGALIAATRFAAQADQPTRAAGFLDEARPRFERLRDDRELVKSYTFAINMLGDAWLRAEQPEQAATVFREMLDELVRKHEADPDSRTARRERAVVADRLGDAYWAAGRADDARSVYRSALAAVEELTASGDGSPQSLYDLSQFHLNLVRAGEDLDERLRHALAGLDLHERLVELVPGHAGLARARLNALERLARLRLERGEGGLAREAFAALATLFQEHGSLDALASLRAFLAEDPAAAPLREVEDFPGWLLENFGDGS